MVPFVIDRSHQNSVAKRSAITLVVQDFDQYRLVLAHTVADQFSQPGFGAVPGQKSAIATENLFFGILGQIDEGLVHRDDRVVLQARI